MFGCKIHVHHILDIFCMEWLARKDIQIQIVRLLYEMGTDVGGLDELHERIPLFVSASKADDLGLSIGHHVDFFHEILREMGNGFCRPNGSGTTLPCIQNEVISPVVHVWYEDA